MGGCAGGCRREDGVRGEEGYEGLYRRGEGGWGVSWAGVGELYLEA